ncbi:MAG: helix-turn-helix transcriptional regulator [Nitriliruptoraceae bacterium]
MTVKVERLVNLTIALLEARAPLTLAEIRRRTGYYQADNLQSARRMFERDKDELRQLGIPIETATAAHGDEVGYRIPRRAYELPDVRFSAEEVAALALAVELAGAPGTPLALAKLAARSPDPTPLPGPVPTRIDVQPAAVDAVAEAVLTRRTVRFTYRAADGSTSERRLDPYGVVQRRGAWYLVGRDHDRDALRAFRLDRCLATPAPIGDAGAFEPPAELDLAAAVSGPLLAGVEVEVAVTPSARWAVQLRGGRDTGRTERGRAVLRLEGLHPVRDRAFLLGLGAEVEVLEPRELRDELARAYEAVLAAHGQEGPA